MVSFQVYSILFRHTVLHNSSIKFSQLSFVTKTSRPLFNTLTQSSFTPSWERHWWLVYWFSVFSFAIVTYPTEHLYEIQPSFLSQLNPHDLSLMITQSSLTQSRWALKVWFHVCVTLSIFTDLHNFPSQLIPHSLSLNSTNGPPWRNIDGHKFCFLVCSLFYLHAHLQFPFSVKSSFPLLYNTTALFTLMDTEGLLSGMFSFQSSRTLTISLQLKSHDLFLITKQ